MSPCPTPRAPPIRLSASPIATKQRAWPQHCTASWTTGARGGGVALLPAAQIGRCGRSAGCLPSYCKAHHCAGAGQTARQAGIPAHGRDPFPGDDRRRGVFTRSWRHVESRPSRSCNLHDRTSHCRGRRSGSRDIGVRGFCRCKPRIETVISEEPLPTAFPETETSRNTDTRGPQLLETTVEGATTALRISDASGVASAVCISEEGTVFEPETATTTTARIDVAGAVERARSLEGAESAGSTGAPNIPDGTSDANAANSATHAPDSPSYTVSEWRFSLPAGTYELRATDILGNTSTGTVTVNLPADPLATLASN